MLTLVGLGLAEHDVTLGGMTALETADVVYAETYTSVWHGDLRRLESRIRKNITVLARDDVEGDRLIDEAEAKNVVLLVPGDPLAATTHFELVMAARERKIIIEIVHAPSVYTAVARTGLQLYKFGRATTLAYREKGFFPSSPYDVIELNKEAGLHSLVLLDIKPDRRMTVPEGLAALLELEGAHARLIIGEAMRVVACAQLGTAHEQIAYATIADIMRTFGDATPTVIVIPGELNFKEEEALALWS